MAELTELADALRRHARIGLDTAIFIYHIEGASRYAAAAGVAFDLVADGTVTGVTSVLTLMELVVKPLQLARPEVADEYEVLVATYPHLIVAEVDRPTARRAAGLRATHRLRPADALRATHRLRPADALRATHRLRPADALQVAACLEHGATLFLTNDRDLRRLTEIEVLLLEDFVAA